jgi:hypothetical protein
LWLFSLVLFELSTAKRWKKVKTQGEKTLHHKFSVIQFQNKQKMRHTPRIANFLQ